MSAFLADWLIAAEQRLRPQTFASYAATVRLYIDPAIGSIPLAKLGPKHVDRMIAGLAARENLAQSTIQLAYAVLRTALNTAVRQGKVIRNVTSMTDAPRRGDREMHPMSRGDARALLGGTVGDPLHALYVTALPTGLRQGELLGLRWQDLDLQRGELTVRHSLQRRSRELSPALSRSDQPDISRWMSLMLIRITSAIRTAKPAR